MFYLYESFKKTKVKDKVNNTVVLKKKKKQNFDLDTVAKVNFN